MKTNRSFSLRERGRSLGYAREGIHAFFASQHNALIHLFLTILMVFSAVFFGVTRMELIVLIVVTGFVWSAEIFNTAIEALLDHIHPHKHPRVKFIKDVSAAAVLVAAVTAFLTGLIIFIPKLF